MKNFISGSRIIAAALFVLVACIFGCSSGESHIIKMRLAKGDVFVQNTTMKMDMKMMGMDMKMDVETGVSFEVMKKSEAETELKMTYTKMHSTMNMSGQPTGLPNTDSLINAPGKRIVGKSVMMKISTDNKITAITGIEDILMDPTADSATRKMMEKMFSKEQMGNLFGMIFSMYPKQAVKIGESWNAETNASMGGANMKIAMKYTLLSVKDGLADIGVTGIINGKGDRKPAV